MHQTMTDSPLGAKAAPSTASVLPSFASQDASASVDDLTSRIAGNPGALSALRRMVQEGLDNGIEGEADDAWLASLADGIRSRATAR